MLPNYFSKTKIFYTQNKYIFMSYLMCLRFLKLFQNIIFQTKFAKLKSKASIVEWHK